jgi:hypothetical protein
MAKSTVEIKLTRTGPRQVRQSAGVAANMASRAQRIANAAGPGMEAGSNMGPTRARGSVVTATAEAMRAEASHRSLTRAVDAGR